MANTADSSNSSEIPEPSATLEIHREQLVALRQRMETLYALRDLRLPKLPNDPGTNTLYTIALPADPDAPLDKFAARTDGRSAPDRENDPDEAWPEWSDLLIAGNDAARQAQEIVAAGVHLPYWGLLWPSGQALAETILAQPQLLQGKQLLELGCGLGLTAAAALNADAQLWAADCFVEALLFTQYNTLHNAGRVPQQLLLDWRTPEGRRACRRQGPFDGVLAADVLYEQEDLEPLLDLIPTLLKPGGFFWLAEPGRRVARSFVATALERGWQDQQTTYERVWPPDDDTSTPNAGTGGKATENVLVTVHRLLPVT